MSGPTSGKFYQLPPDKENTELQIVEVEISRKNSTAKIKVISTLIPLCLSCSLVLRT